MIKIKVTNPGQVKELLNEYNLKLKRSLGQNLLVDKNILAKIIELADIKEGETVIEIGAGLGSLTTELAKGAGKVIALELDERLIPILEEVLATYDNAEVIQGDALEVNFNELADGEYKIVANLPYNVANPIVMRLLENDFNVSEIIVMVQKEVAERMTADPGGKDYGILSIAIQYYSIPEIAFKVPPNVFIPRPKVESAVISLKVREEPRVEVEDEQFFFTIVRAAFQQRRKTIRNALRKAANINLSKEIVDKALKKAEIDSRRRGEKLSIEQFAKLSDILFNLRK